MSTQFTNRQWRLPNNENKDKQSNYSMDFDGSSYIGFSNVSSLQNTNILSISMWFNLRTLTTQRMLGHYTANNGLTIESDSNVIYFVIANGSLTYATLPISGNITTNTWFNVTMVYDGSQSSNSTKLKVYLNNIEKSLSYVGTIPSSLAVNTSAVLGLGSTTPPSNVDMDGKLDGVSIFDYALTDGTGGTVNQIAALYGSSSTGIGNPMTLNPVAYYPLGDQDAFNGANYLVPNSSLKDYVFDFDGSNDYIDYGNVDALKLGAGDFTWSSWINPDSWGSSFEALYTCLASNGVWIGIDGTNFVLRIVNGSNIIAYSTLPTVNTWTNICITRVSGACTLYYNGVSVATATSTHNFNVNGNVNLGGYGTYGNFNGKISNVQVFNTGLSATGSNSVETLYNNGFPLTSMSGFTSLVSWWKLDASDTYDGTNWTIEDHAGSNDGTSSGMIQANLVQSDLSFTSGYSPYALEFDGTNDYITISGATNLNISGDLTMSMWFKANSFTNYEYIFRLGSGTTNNGDRMIGFKNSKISTNTYADTSGAYDVLGNTTLSTGVWYHVAIVYSSNTVIIYLNGNADSSSIPTTMGTISYVNTTIAQSYNSNYFDGSISNCSIWNAALTSAQVTEIYSEGIPQNLNNHSAVSSLVSWWQLGSNSSFNTNWTVLDEVAASGNNGTSVNMGEDDIVDGVGSYANGLSSGMGGDEVVGDAPYSSSNSLSVNMDVLDRVEDTPS